MVIFFSTKNKPWKSECVEMECLNVSVTPGMFRHHQEHRLGNVSTEAARGRCSAPALPPSSLLPSWTPKGAAALEPRPPPPSPPGPPRVPPSTSSPHSFLLTRVLVWVSLYGAQGIICVSKPLLNKDVKEDDNNQQLMFIKCRVLFHLTFISALQGQYSRQRGIGSSPSRGDRD